MWGGPARLEEELRIGVLEGPQEYMFGRILAVAPDLRGGVHVFDGQAPALRHYGPDGRYLRTFGGRGSGPGEYLDDALGLGVARDGRVLLRDPRNARINVYAPDGAPLEHWPVASGLFTDRAMLLDTAGHVYLKILLDRPRPNEPWPVGLLHLDSQGRIVDSIAQPVIAGQPTTAEGVFTPAKVWDWSPFGYPVVGVNDVYSFELRDPNGPVIRVVRDQEPVPVQREERAEREARNDWMRVNRGQFLTAEIPPVPAVKPAYRDLRVADGGRIWVQRYAAAVKSEAGSVPEVQPGQPPPLTWREPLIFDVFEPDGTYLGEVHLPERTSVVALEHERVWAIERGRLDEQYVVAFRLVPEAPVP